MLGKEGQLGTHGEGRGGQIVGRGASHAVRVSKNVALFISRMDLALVPHIQSTKVGYQSVA
jgi:hypothetical protein